jgi:muconolactone delta-isomerase
MKRRSIMKFMIIARYKDSFYALPPKKQGELMDATGPYMEKWTKEGKLKEAYSLGNMKGVMGILDLKSSEDLVRLAYESPLFPFVDAELTPLVEIDVVKKVQAKK